MPQENSPLYTAAVAGFFAVAGWGATYVFNLRKDVKSSQRARDKELFEELTTDYPPPEFSKIIQKSEIGRMRSFFDTWTRLDHEFVDSKLQKTLNRLTEAVDVMVMITHDDDPCLRVVDIFKMKLVIAGLPPKDDPESKKKHWKKRARMLVTRRNEAIRAYEELFRLGRRLT